MPQTGRSPYHKTNLSWPLIWTGNRLQEVYLATRFEAALRHLMGTKKGSYYSDPDYGSIYYLLRTQGMNETAKAMALTDMETGCRRYIPDIIIMQQQVTLDPIQHAMDVEVVWNIRGANTQMHGDLGRPKKITVSM